MKFFRPRRHGNREKGSLSRPSASVGDWAHIVDRGASPHIIRQSSRTPEELKTVTNSDTPILMMSANGSVETNEEATVYIKKDLDNILVRQVRRFSGSAVIGKVVQHCVGYSYTWMTGRQPSLRSEWSQWPDTSRDSLPDWLQPFTEGCDRIIKKRLYARRRRRSSSKPTSKHYKLTHSHPNSNWDKCKMTKTVRARCQKRPEMRTDGFALPTKLERSYQRGSQSFDRRQ